MRGISVWAFGLATTIFLIAMWGRAVVVDVQALSAAAGPLAESAAVVEFFTDWLDTELVEAGVEPQASELVIDDVLGQSSVGKVLEQFVAELVVAAAAPGTGVSSVDMSGLFEPAVPEIGMVLRSADVPLPEARIAAVVSELDPLVIRQAGTKPYLGSGSTTASRLGTAAVLSLVAMAVTGWTAVANSGDRIGEVRGLATRVALGALSFTILLRAGSWVLDPRGGRAPIAESASMIAGSKSLVPFGLAVIAFVAAAAAWAYRRTVKRAEGSQSPGEPPTQPEERQLIRSG